MKRFCGELVFKDHRRVYHSTLGSRAIKKNKGVHEGGGAKAPCAEENQRRACTLRVRWRGRIYMRPRPRHRTLGTGQHLASLHLLLFPPLPPSPPTGPTKVLHRKIPGRLLYPTFISIFKKRMLVKRGGAYRRGPGPRRLAPMRTSVAPHTSTCFGVWG